MRHVISTHLALFIATLLTMPPAVAGAQQKTSRQQNAPALQEAKTLNEEFEKLYGAGKYNEALPLAERALLIRERELGPNHPDVAQSLNNLAVVYLGKGEFARAEALFVRSLAIREKALDPHHTDIAESLNNLAALYEAKGEFAKAEPMYVRALAIDEKVNGPDHPNVAQSLNNLALLYDKKGDYTKAEALYARALAIREKAFGAEHAEVAGSLNNLANLYYRRGDYEKAEPLFARALTLYEKTFGPDNLSVAVALNNLAFVYNDKGDYAKAEPLFLRALAIREKKLNPNHPLVALSVNNLAALYRAKGEREKAEPLFARALEAYEKTLGPEHPSIAAPLNNLAALHEAKGDYAGAEPLYVRALAIYEKALGPGHPNVANGLSNLATLYFAKGDIAQAVALQSRANEARERDLARNLAAGSERQKLLYLNLSARDTDFTLTLNLKHAPNDATARRMAMTALLRRKGRALDAMTDTIATLRRRAAPEDQALFDQLAEARSQLAAATLKGPGREGVAPYRASIKALEEAAENLEARASARSVEFRAQATPISLEAVQKSIPEGAALVEFATYRPFDLKSPQPGALRYAAYVLRHQGDPEVVELGEAKPIDVAVDALRRALRNPGSGQAGRAAEPVEVETRADVKQLARALDRRVMAPVRKLLGEAEAVLLSPDGSLNLIPFAALVDEKDRYLVESYSFAYLTSGRDLLRLQSRIQSQQPATVIADPDFGSRNAPGQDSSAPAAGGSDFSKVFFTPLPGSEQEAQALKEILPGAAVLTKAQATETALKQVDSPALLHVATHGFFLEDIAPATATKDTRLLLLQSNPLRGDAGAARVENPLLRSGLGLAGANLKKSGNDDGILTALEAAGLDLWGTKLVVLSACDTGVGEVRNGEGVYGLRRALVLAGSETQVMSLWPVSDTGTRDLMIEYYKALQAGQGRSAALQQVQLKMLARKSRSHPYYWASFIQSGEWASLDGKR